jgi:NAD(P)H-dependent FMN reductase
MPLFSVDKEKNGFPSQAHQFLKEIENCDAIICSLAEHNRNFTVAFKNVFDWASRINVKVFQNKSMLLLTTSPGKFGGGNVMNIAKNTFPQFGADIKATFSLPSFYENFDMNKGVVNEIYSKELDMAISVFKSSI